MDSVKWWQKAVFYQIYPRSFADGNGDGIGDLSGIISKLDYLQDLGVDGIWLSPHFPSPLCDCGYDVADYRGVAPEYGTLETFKRFLDEAHQRGIRLVLDLVLNHTSDQHPWFIESRRSRTNQRRDWYIWREGRGSQPPNDWLSTFGGSAWELDPHTNAYYYHFFFKGQPDLNWHNPAVKEAMFNEARFWLDMGVDGFRLDAIGTIFEDPTFKNHDLATTQEDLYRMARNAKTEEDWAKIAPIWEAMFAGQHDLPEVHELMRDFRKVIDEYPDRVLIGETDDIAFYGEHNDEIHLNFNFPLMETPLLSPAWVLANQTKRLSALPAGAWPCNTLGNHDSPRVYNRFGDGEHNDQWARINLALMLTLKGTPFLYNGEEIGMSDYLVMTRDQVRDPISLIYADLEQRLFNTPAEQALQGVLKEGRDKCRTPMQWANQPNAGFSPTAATPWLPVNPNYAAGINVTEQQNDPASLLNYYKHLIHIRRNTPALVSGDYQPLESTTKDVLAFLRSTPQQRCLVLLNMSAQTQSPTLAIAEQANLVFSNPARPQTQEPASQISLAPFEVYIAELA